jgi:2-C-methyl-D-erythritol 4-phosphate cytidylyltransferase
MLSSGIQKIVVILVLPEDDLETWQCALHRSIISQAKLILQKGGDTRFQSVKNGLEKIEAMDWSLSTMACALW